MDEKRISVLLDKFYQYIDHNLSCTLYEAPVIEQKPSSAIQVLDKLYNPPDLCAEFWCDGTKAYFVKYRGDKQAYDRFCQLAEIAAEFLPLPKKEERSNAKYWVYHLIDSLRTDPKNNIEKHVYCKKGDSTEEIIGLPFTENREMMILYNWAKGSTQKKVLVFSSDIKNLFNASARVLEKMYKPLEEQPQKTVNRKNGTQAFFPLHPFEQRKFEKFEIVVDKVYDCTPEAEQLLKQTVNSLDLAAIRSYLILDCGIQNPELLTSNDVIEILKRWLEKKTSDGKTGETKQQPPFLVLRKFIEIHCDLTAKPDVQSKVSLLHEYNLKKKIKLPKLAQKYQKGQHKYYYVDDLKKNWPTYQRKMPTLPPLKQPEN